MSGTKVTTFTERLNYLITSSGKTASHIATDLGLSKQAISTWQTGLRAPKRPTIETIARYFNVDIAWLMGYDTEMHPDPNAVSDEPTTPEPQNEKIVILARAARHMSTEDQDKLLDVARIMFKKAFDEADKEK